MSPPRLRVSATAMFVVTLLVAGPAMTGSAQTPHADPGTAAEAAGPGDVAGSVELPSGRRVYLECHGTGSPTVVLVSGSGNAADAWHDVDQAGPGAGGTSVFGAIAGFTRVCAYDRPGTQQVNGEPSRSDPVPLPRTAAEMLTELHELLDVARIRGPYVLVGHSMGGLLVRLDASLRADDVVGIVSVDAAHETFYDAYERLLAPDQYTSPLSEVDVLALRDETRLIAAEHPLPVLPMVVIEHSRDRQVVPNPFGFPTGFPIEALEQAFQGSQDQLAGLVPGSTHLIAELSGHAIYADQPDLVVDATRQIVDQARRNAAAPAAAVETDPSLTG